MRIASILLLLFVIACTDIPDSELRQRPTELKVKVIGTDYKAVEGAYVYLYRDPISFMTKSQWDYTGTYVDDIYETNEEGMVHFTDLEPYNYFIYAAFEDGNKVYDNSQRYYNLYDYLTENAVTTVTVKMELLRSEKPDSVVLDYVSFMPMREGEDFTGEAVDTVWADAMVFEDYDDTKKMSEQTIISRDETLQFYGKREFGTKQFEAYLDNPLEFKLANLEEEDESPPNPATHRYTLHIEYFANKIDYDNRAAIYDESKAKTDYRLVEDVIDLNYEFNDQIPDPTYFDGFGYAKIINTGTFYIDYEHKILLNVTWK